MVNYLLFPQQAARVKTMRIEESHQHLRCMYFIWIPISKKQIVKNNCEKIWTLTRILRIFKRHGNSIMVIFKKKKKPSEIHTAIIYRWKRVRFDSNNLESRWECSLNKTGHESSTAEAGGWIHKRLTWFSLLLWMWEVFKIKIIF